MIDVQSVLDSLPRFDRFCSVDELHGLVDRLTSDDRFEVTIVGASENGRPIHHVRFGSGAVKALAVGGPHCHEPVGGLTVYALLTLLRDRNRPLLAADVEWHIVPCIDPDGAVLNEGWSRHPFTLERYMKNFYCQIAPDKVDGSFPIRYKKLAFDRPSTEARVLQRVLDEVKPDFYLWLHNAYLGGVIYFSTEQLDQRYYDQLHELRSAYDLPLQLSPPHREWCRALDDGIFEWPKAFTKTFYDYLEQNGSAPEQVLKGNGATSVDYLCEINPDALTFVTEVPHLKHPSDGSTEPVPGNLRRLKLRVDADNKFLATLILEEWAKVRDDLDPQCPFYQGMLGNLGGLRDTLCQAAPLATLPTNEILFNPGYGRPLTEGDRFAVHVFDRFHFLRRNYEFVRLLKASEQTPEVRAAVHRLDDAFDEALDELAAEIDFDAIEVVDCSTLLSVQLGSGLIALNSLLESSRQSTPTGAAGTR
jgi:zinc carboxypeptidase